MVDPYIVDNPRPHFALALGDVSAVRGAGLLAASSVPLTVGGEKDGQGRGKREKADEEQEQIEGFAGSHASYKVIDA